jgi:hypothetical protein
MPPCNQKTRQLYCVLQIDNLYFYEFFENTDVYLGLTITLSNSTKNIFMLRLLCTVKVRYYNQGTLLDSLK